MSRTSPHVSRPRPGPEWSVQDVRGYEYWQVGVDDCATCGSEVRLDDDHYGMELVRHRPTEGKLGIERQRFVFCSSRCVSRWQHE